VNLKNTVSDFCCDGRCCFDQGDDRSGVLRCAGRRYLAQNTPLGFSGFGYACRHSFLPFRGRGIVEPTFVLCDTLLCRYQNLLLTVRAVRVDAGAGRLRFRAAEPELCCMLMSLRCQSRRCRPNRCVGTLPALAPKLSVAVGDGANMEAHLSPEFRLAFLSRHIILEQSSPSRVRFAAPNNGAPLTAPGRSEKHSPKRERLPVECLVEEGPPHCHNGPFSDCHRQPKLENASASRGERVRNLRGLWPLQLSDGPPARRVSDAGKSGRDSFSYRKLSGGLSAAVRRNQRSREKQLW
jgi:hypothetical protein